MRKRSPSPRRDSRVSTVKDGPVRSSSAGDTRKRSSPTIAAVSIASRSSALAIGPSCFNGERRAGTKYTRSSPSSSRASFAIARWPTWTGSKEPPNTPIPLTRHPPARSTPSRECRCRQRFTRRAAIEDLAKQVTGAVSRRGRYGHARHPPFGERARDARRGLTRFRKVELVQRDQLRSLLEAVPVAPQLGVDRRDVLERLGAG